jgi:RNA exonuclease 4
MRLCPSLSIANKSYVIQALSNEDGSRAKKRIRRTSSSSSMQIEKGKHKAIKELETRDSSSPAPTSLPWFAEDLSPEDLALVHRAGGRASTSSTKLNTLEDNQEDMDEINKRKKDVILGGSDLSKEKKEPGTYVAIDCEMVGVGPDGSESMLARVSIVNWHGAVLMDSFVKPKEKVTDYRTWVSGVRPSDLQGAPNFQEVQSEVAKLIKGRVLVGHAIHNDLKALLLSHPRPLIRDTAQNKHCRELAKTKYPSLKKLVALKLGIDIQKQGSEHSPVEDARATMALYRTLHADWQKSSSISNAIIGKGWKGTDKKARENGGQAKTDTARQARTSNSSTQGDWWKQVGQ